MKFGYFTLSDNRYPNNRRSPEQFVQEIYNQALDLASSERSCCKVICVIDGCLLGRVNNGVDCVQRGCTCLCTECNL